MSHLVRGSSSLLGSGNRGFLPFESTVRGSSSLVGVRNRGVSAFSTVRGSSPLIGVHNCGVSAFENTVRGSSSLVGVRNRGFLPFDIDDCRSSSLCRSIGRGASVFFLDEERIFPILLVFQPSYINRGKFFLLTEDDFLWRGFPSFLLSLLGTSALPFLEEPEPPQSFPSFYSLDAELKEYL